MRNKVAVALSSRTGFPVRERWLHPKQNYHLSETHIGCQPTPPPRINSGVRWSFCPTQLPNLAILLLEPWCALCHGECVFLKSMDNVTANLQFGNEGSPTTTSENPRGS